MGNTRVELAHKLNTIFHKPPTKNNSSSEVYNYEKVFLNPNAQQLLRIDLSHSRERERERDSSFWQHKTYFLRTCLLSTQNGLNYAYPLRHRILPNCKIHFLLLECETRDWNGFHVHASYVKYRIGKASTEGIKIGKRRRRQLQRGRRRRRCW